jgi:hypothetical protein
MNPLIKIATAFKNGSSLAQGSRYRLRRAFTLSSLLLVACSSSTARTFPLEKITIGTEEFIGTVSYDVEKAYAGNQNLLLSISLKTMGGTNLQLIKCEAPDQPTIQFAEISKQGANDRVTGVQTTDYAFSANIPEGTEPRIHRITLSFSYPNKENTNRTFWLYVGVRNKGKLGIAADGVGAVEFFTGTKNKYGLELVNNFADYPVNVRSITIKSDPPGLIESTTVPVNLSIEPLQRATVDLDLKATPMSFTNLLSGFNDSTRLLLHVNYDDSYGRVITDFTHPVKMKVRPRDRILALAMIVGVLVGALIKLYLQRLQQQGLITRREVLIAVGVTSLIGLVVSFIAVVGRIKIIAFDQMGSYDNPAVIFIIGLAGAVGGAQLLSTFFKSAPQPAEQKAQP